MPSAEPPRLRPSPYYPSSIRLTTCPLCAYYDSDSLIRTSCRSCSHPLPDGFVQKGYVTWFFTRRKCWCCDKLNMVTAVKCQKCKFPMDGSCRIVWVREDLIPKWTVGGGNWTSEEVDVDPLKWVWEKRNRELREKKQGVREVVEIEE